MKRIPLNLVHMNTLVTGGGTGIGRAIALALAQRGARLAVTGRRREPLQAVVAEITAQGGHAIWAQADLTQSADIDTLLMTRSFGLCCLFGGLFIAVAYAVSDLGLVWIFSWPAAWAIAALVKVPISAPRSQIGARPLADGWWGAPGARTVPRRAVACKRARVRG